MLYTSISSVFLRPMLSALGTLSSIRYVALDQGQVEEYIDGEAPRPPFTCPALLISIRREEMTHYKDRDRSTVDIDIRLLTDTAQIGNYAAPDNHLKSATEPYELVSDIVDAAIRACPEWLRYEGLDRGMRMRSLSELVLHFNAEAYLHR